LRSLIKILILIVFSGAVTAQDRDTLSAYERYMPTGVRIGTDLGSIAKHYSVESFSGWEINADADFHRYYLALDYGTWSRNYQGESLDYNNDGRYWRIGPDVNFLTKDAERNMVFLGLRYARGVFDETFRVIDTDPNWGTNDRYENPYRNTNVNARWLELTGGLRVKMYKWIWMGYTARFKFGLKTGDTQEMLPHDVPGYGKTNKETTWGFNYQLFVRIPVRPTPPLPPVKKKKK
jgi:hypothetical protein